MDLVEDDVIVDKLTSFVSDSAKPCVSKALDYTLLVLLLVLQFMRCSPPSTEDILDQLQNPDGSFNATYASSIQSVYSCNLSSTQKSSIFYASNPWINGLVFAAIIIAFLYGIVCGLGIWLHARKNEKIEVPPTIKKIYAFTDRIMIIDTALEIPVAFFWAPLITIILWTFFAISCIGLILLSSLYTRTVPDDPNAQSVFDTSAFLVAFSLFKLTGEVSQYCVMYIASKRAESEGLEDVVSSMRKMKSFNSFEKKKRPKKHEKKTEINDDDFMMNNKLSKVSNR